MSYPSPPPYEAKKPGFLHRPVPMWAFLAFVIIIVVLMFASLFIGYTPPSIQQPLVLIPDSRTVSITPGQTFTANFTVANLNSTNTISDTVTLTLVPANSNVTLTASGVQTGTSFAPPNSDGTLPFQPGGNTLVVRVAANANALRGNYTIQVSLS